MKININGRKKQKKNNEIIIIIIIKLVKEYKIPAE